MPEGDKNTQWRSTGCTLSYSSLPGIQKPNRPQKPPQPVLPKIVKFNFWYKIQFSKFGKRKQKIERFSSLSIGFQPVFNSKFKI
jgi:hypothetical protein